MVKVGIYVRVSTREQAEEGYSVEAQLEKLKLYCKSKEWIVIDEYIDGGFSGGDTNRPGLQKLIRDATAKKMDMVLVYKLDRLSRSQKDTLYLIEEVFNANGVDFTSMQENFDTSTPLGMAMVGILSVFAQLERAQIKERMIMGKEQRAKAGLYKGGMTPVGYDYDPVTSQLVINEYEAMQVKLIYQKFLDGDSFEIIRKSMEGKYSTKYGNSYDSTKLVRRILKNPIYIGKIKCKSEVYEGKHNPIIDDETWEKVQTLYKQAINNRPADGKTPYRRTTLLGGLLYCGYCGSKYGANSFRSVNAHGKKRCYLTYSCYGRTKDKRMGKDFSCKAKHWKREELESIIWNEILKLDIEFVGGEKLLSDETQEEKKAIIQKQIEKLNEQLFKCMDLYTIKSMPIELISERVDKLSEEKEKLEEELESLEDEKPIDQEEVLSKILTAKNLRENGSPEEQRALIEYLIEKIVLKDDEMTIRWRFL